MPAELAPRVLTLAGKSIELDGCRLRIGVPQTRALRPATTLQFRGLVFWTRYTP